MSGDQVTITQIGNPLDYVRLWDNSAGGGMYIDLDAESKTVAGTAKELWDETSDILYIGNASTFAYIGFLPSVAGSYSGFTIEYASSGSYTNTALHQVDKWFEIAENFPAKFTDGSHFSITSSPAGTNDGTYTCNGDATWTGTATRIVVNQTIPGASAGGTISTIWTDITDDVKDTNYTPFTERGYLAFPIQGDWELRTIDGVSAYWVRGFVTSVATTATMFHMMRSLVIDQVLQLGSSLGAGATRYTRDINGGLGKRDRGYKGVRKGNIDMTPLSLTASELNLLLDWEAGQYELYLEDSRQSSPIDFTADSFYKTYTGRLDKVPDGLKSMEKMVDTDYKLQFLFDASTTLSSALGLTL